MDIFREDKGKLRKMNTRKIRSNQQTEKIYITEIGKEFGIIGQLHEKNMLSRSVLKEHCRIFFYSVYRKVGKKCNPGIGWMDSPLIGTTDNLMLS